MSANSSRLLGRLLRDVSRSFYLTLRFLPHAVRDQIGLAYLLARATDTLADTEALPPADRLKALDDVRRRVLGQSVQPLNFANFVKFRSGGASAAELVLLSRFEEAVSYLASFAPADQEAIRSVVIKISSGQELDLQRFAGAGSQRIIALQLEEELDDYTYRVAGCVGEFWTRVCLDHLFPDTRCDELRLLAEAVRFGKGLQLVNILRDLPTDLKAGRCYIPSRALAKLGLTPCDLLNSSSEARFRQVFERYLSQAAEHLSAGWRYTNSLPFGQVRLRLACAWPLLIGAATLKKLKSGKILNATQRIKVSRREVRFLVLQSVVWYPWPRRWRQLFKDPSC